MLTITPTALILLLSSVLPVLTAPTQSRCRCYVVDTRKPYVPASALPEPHHKNDVCAPLGQELEHWRTTDPEIYQTFLDSIIRQYPPGTPTDDDLKPLPTSVLLEMARTYGMGLGNGGRGEVSVDAPGQAPFHERIICRTSAAEENEYEDSTTTLFVLCVIVVMAVLACATECLVLLFSFFGRQRKSENRLRLSGEEKKLLAYANSRPSSPYSEKVPDQLFVCTAYQFGFEEEEHLTPVL